MMRILLKVVCLLPLALPLTFVLLRWPLWFAVVVGGGCVLALCIMGYQIATSAQRPEPVDHRAAATVDGIPVKEVTVLR